VEKKFANETEFISEDSKIKPNKKDFDGFRRFEEFIEDLKKNDEKEEDEGSLKYSTRASEDT